MTEKLRQGMTAQVRGLLVLLSLLLSASLAAPAQGAEGQAQRLLADGHAQAEIGGGEARLPEDPAQPGLDGSGAAPALAPKAAAMRPAGQSAAGIWFAARSAITLPVSGPPLGARAPPAF